VVATAAGVALVAHYAAGIPWAAAVTLGAIVGPTDPVALLTVARRMGVSPRLVGLLDGENLRNDFTALVIYVIEATVTRAFSAPAALLQFVVTAVAGVLIGFAVGALAALMNARVDDPFTAPVVALCGAYLAFLPAEGPPVSAILVGESDRTRRIPHGIFARRTNRQSPSAGDGVVTEHLVAAGGCPTSPSTTTLSSAVGATSPSRKGWL